MRLQPVLSRRFQDNFNVREIMTFQ